MGVTALTPLPPPLLMSTGRTRNAKMSICAYVGDIATPIKTVGLPGEYRIETSEGVHALTDVPCRLDHGEYQTSRTMASTNLHFIRSFDIEISLRTTVSSRPSLPPLVVRCSSLFRSVSSSGNLLFPKVSWNSYESQIRVHEVWTGVDDLDGRPEGAMDVHEPPPPLLATVISIFFSAYVIVIVVIITLRDPSHRARQARGVPLYPIPLGPLPHVQ